MNKNRILSFAISFCLLLNLFNFIVPEFKIKSTEASMLIPNFNDVFTSANIGTDESLNEAVFDNENGTLSITGAGTTISKSNKTLDSFNYTSTLVSGDFTITACIKNFYNAAAPKAVTGIIIRDTNTLNDSNYFGMVIDSEAGELRSCYRNFTDTEKKGGSNPVSDYYKNTYSDIFIKIKKTGNKVTYTAAFDDEFEIGAVTNSKNLTLNSNAVYVGFGITNGLKSTGNAAADFTDILLEQGGNIIFDSNAFKNEADVVPPTGDADTTVPPANDEDTIVPPANDEDTVVPPVEDDGTAIPPANDDDTILPDPPTEDEDTAIPTPPAEDEDTTVPTPPGDDSNDNDDTSNGAPKLTYSNGLLAAELIANETITSSMTFEDINEALLIIALYDENNKMIDYAYTSEIISANGKKTLSLDFKLPSNIKGCTIKTFVWNNFMDIAPLSAETKLN